MKIILESKIIQGQIRDKWVQYDGEPPLKLYYFTFHKDSKGIWLEQAYVDEEYHRQGYTTAIIKCAIEKYGKVLFSSADKLEHKKYNDIRYVSSLEMQQVIDSLLLKGIITSDCYCSPYINPILHKKM